MTQGTRFIPLQLNREAKYFILLGDILCLVHFSKVIIRIIFSAFVLSPILKFLFSYFHEITANQVNYWITLEVDMAS